jgi:hypothetical protein
MSFQPFHLSGLDTGYVVTNLAEWNDRTYERLSVRRVRS